MNRKPKSLPPVVSRETWLEARKALLIREKEATRLHDALAAERRRLPMVKVEKDYVFEGPDGEVRLVDMFEGRSQLYVHHFMWIDQRNDFCPGCMRAADLTFRQALFTELHKRDITFVAISRVPLSRIEEARSAYAFRFPWYSSLQNDFNYDYHVTLDERKHPIEYNYRGKQELLQNGFSEDMLKGDWPGNSVFLRDGNNVYHTYSAYARGLDLHWTPHNFLDFTPYGRQEQCEDSPDGWPKEGATL
ncbi:MAG: DUF899 domain-containing protein [Puniceicoccaceae bacterium]